MVASGRAQDSDEAYCAVATVRFWSEMKTQRNCLWAHWFIPYGKTERQDGHTVAHRRCHGLPTSRSRSLTWSSTAPSSWIPPLTPCFDQLLCPFPSPPSQRTGPASLFLKRPSPPHYFLKYTEDWAILFLRLWIFFFLPSSCSLLFSFPPRPLTKLIPPPSPTQLHSISFINTRGTKRVAALPRDFLLSPPLPSHLSIYSLPFSPLFFCLSEQQVGKMKVGWQLWVPLLRPLQGQCEVFSLIEGLFSVVCSVKAVLIEW